LLICEKVAGTPPIATAVTVFRWLPLIVTGVPGIPKIPERVPGKPIKLKPPNVAVCTPFDATIVPEEALEGTQRG